MGQTRKSHSKEFKAKVALEAVEGVHSLSELSSRYKVHPTRLRTEGTGTVAFAFDNFRVVSRARYLAWA